MESGRTVLTLTSTLLLFIHSGDGVTAAGEVAVAEPDRPCDVQIHHYESRNPAGEDSTRMIRLFTPHFAGRVALEKLHAMPGYRLTLNAPGRIPSAGLHIPFPVYRLDAGDIRNDGTIDVLLGVIKSTHFDPEVKRRLFILQCSSSGFSPVWLGSRVCRNLVDFHTVREGERTCIMTIEQNRHHAFCNGLYRWQGFGLELISYTNEHTDYDTVLAYFDRRSNRGRM
jgi:hypothetical protein